jgi:hypothetical protein
MVVSSAVMTVTMNWRMVLMVFLVLSFIIRGPSPDPSPVREGRRESAFILIVDYSS